MSTPEYNKSIAFTKSKMDELRNELIALRDKLNTHIGESGNIHPTASTLQSGFMSSDSYKDLTQVIPNLYAQAVATLADNNIPSGTTCWYYGYPDDLPEGWSLTSENTLNKLYPITQQEDGGSLRGTVEFTEIPGTQEEVTGKISPNSLVTTLALFSIRKD